MLEKIEGYKKSYLARLQREKAENEERAKEALEDVEKIKQYLGEEVGVREIYLFGSLAKGEFRKDSDIDIAVSGIKEESFFRVYSILDNFTNFEIELVDLDEKDDFFRQQIRKRGKKIYEKRSQ